MMRLAPFAALLAPLLALLALLALGAFGTIVLDHDILGRDAQGWPVLYKTPFLRHAVDAFHFALMFAAPPTLAVLALTPARHAGVTLPWILTGGVLVCVAGALPVIEALWTGVKGTSGLRLALADDAGAIAIRLAVSLAIYAAALLLLPRRSLKPA